MSWRWIWIAALLAAVVVGFGALSGRSGESSSPQAVADKPTFYAKDAVILQTQADGSPQLRLAAERIEQQPDDNSITLNEVRVDYLKIPEKPWILTAARGVVPADSLTVQFSGDVRLRPADAPDATYLNTNTLTIDTQRNLAYTTASPTTMQFGRYTLEVERFEADLVTEKLTLESVHGRADRS